MRACPACGASNGETDDFCGNCGNYLGWSDEVTAGRPPTPEPEFEPEPEPGPAPAPTAAPAAGAPGSSAGRPAPEQQTPGPTPNPTTPPPDSTPRTTPPESSTTAPLHHPTPSAARPESSTTAPPHESAPRPTPPEPSTTALPHDPTPRTAPPEPSTTAPPHDSTPRSARGSGGGPGPVPAAPVVPAPVTPQTSAPVTPQTPARVPPQAPAPVPPQALAPVPVKPAKAVAPRPVVRPVPGDDDVSGAPCPACGTPNPPGRRFCRRCANPLTPAAAPAPLPWWRTVWPFRRRARSGSGRMLRLFVVLGVVLALCAGGFLLLPAGRDLFEDTRDKLGKAVAVTPSGVVASGQLPGHPADASVDGVSNRYWGVPGSGASVTYTFGTPIRLVDLIITNGASKSAEQYARQARALQFDAEFRTAHGQVRRQRLSLNDKAGPQPIQVGVSDVTSIRFVLRSPAGLSGGRHIALAEVEFFRRA